MSNNNDSTNTTDVFDEYLEEYKRLSEAIGTLRVMQEQFNQEDEIFKALDLGAVALVRLWTLHQTNPELGWLLD